ncbi:MAG TPA: hotdog domain-containing protein [Anaerolineaceae bacterium]|jgi:acyl-CoA hydrolase
MQMMIQTTQHLIKSEDLNHHGTLYAGRSAEWFVESGFISAANLTSPENIVCLQIHGMCFTRPVHLGEIVRFDSRVAFTGRTKIVAYVQMKAKDEMIVEGFITFINVDAEGHSLPHGVVITPETEAEIEIQARAKYLFN